MRPKLLALLGALGDPEPGVRAVAAGALARTAPAAVSVPRLVALVDDPDWQVAVRGDADLGHGAQKALVAIGAPAAPAPLAAALDQPPARERALRALHELGPAAAEAVPRLIPLLGEDESRFDAVAVLEAVGEEALVPLRSALGSGDAKLRAGAAEALSKLGAAAAAAIPELVGLLADEEAGYYASQALGAIGEPAIPALAARLGAEGVDGLHAGSALQRIGAAAVPALAAAVASDDAAARRNAAFALQRLGPAAASAIPALEQALVHEDTRLFVERALAAIRGE